MQSIDGDKSAGRDMATKQQIASFPPEIHDPTLLSKVKGEYVEGTYIIIVTSHSHTHLLSTIKSNSVGNPES